MQCGGTLGLEMPRIIVNEIWLHWVMTGISGVRITGNGSKVSTLVSHTCQIE